MKDEEWGLPENPKRRKVAEAFKAAAIEVWGRLPNTGGCQTFYTPEEWAERGEQYGLNSELIICHDGGEVSNLVSYDAEDYQKIDEMISALNKRGYWVEQCTCWYSAVYKNEPNVIADELPDVITEMMTKADELDYNKLLEIREGLADEGWLFDFDLDCNVIQLKRRKEGKDKETEPYVLVANVDDIDDPNLRSKLTSIQGKTFTSVSSAINATGLAGYDTYIEGYLMDTFVNHYNEDLLYVDGTFIVVINLEK